MTTARYWLSADKQVLPLWNFLSIDSNILVRAYRDVDVLRMFATTVAELTSQILSNSLYELSSES